MIEDRMKLWSHHHASLAGLTTERRNPLVRSDEWPGQNPLIKPFLSPLPPIAFYPCWGWEIPETTVCWFPIPIGAQKRFSLIVTMRLLLAQRTLHGIWPGSGDYSLNQLKGLATASSLIHICPRQVADSQPEPSSIMLEASDKKASSSSSTPDGSQLHCLWRIVQKRVLFDAQSIRSLGLPWSSQGGSSGHWSPCRHHHRGVFESVWKWVPKV